MEQKKWINGLYADLAVDGNSCMQGGKITATNLVIILMPSLDDFVCAVKRFRKSRIVTDEIAF